MNREPHHTLTAIENRIEEIIREKFVSDVNQTINRTALLEKECSMDSLDQVELVMALEVEYNIPLDDDSLNATPQNICDIAKLCESKIVEFYYKEAK